MNCFNCKSEDLAYKSESDRGNYKVYQCSQCNHIFSPEMEILNGRKRFVGNFKISVIAGFIAFGVSYGLETLAEMLNAPKEDVLAMHIMFMACFIFISVIFILPQEEIASAKA
jgi:hypothetical protein